MTSTPPFWNTALCLLAGVLLSVGGSSEAKWVDRGVVRLRVAQ